METMASCIQAKSVANPCERKGHATQVSQKTWSPEAVKKLGRPL